MERLVFLAEFGHQTDEIQWIFSILEQRMSVLEKQVITPEAVESAGYWLHNFRSF